MINEENYAFKWNKKVNKQKILFRKKNIKYEPDKYRIHIDCKILSCFWTVFASTWASIANHKFSKLQIYANSVKCKHL